LDVEERLLSLKLFKFLAPELTIRVNLGGNLEYLLGVEVALIALQERAKEYLVLECTIPPALLIGISLVVHLA